MCTTSGFVFSISSLTFEKDAARFSLSASCAGHQLFRVTDPYDLSVRYMDDVLNVLIGDFAATHDSNA